MNCNYLLTFRRDAGTDFNIGFFDNEATFDRTATSSSILRSENPFMVCVRQGVDGDDTDAIAVIAAFARTETNTPFGLPSLGQDFGILSRLHCGLCGDSVIAKAHFDECMALLFVSNAGLDWSEAAEDGAKFGLATRSTTNEQSSAQDLDVTSRNSWIHVGPFGIEIVGGRLICLRSTSTGRSALTIVVATTTTSTAPFVSE